MRLQSGHIQANPDRGLSPIAVPGNSFMSGIHSFLYVYRSLKALAIAARSMQSACSDCSFFQSAYALRIKDIVIFNDILIKLSSIQDQQILSNFQNLPNEIMNFPHKKN